MKIVCVCVRAIASFASRDRSSPSLLPAFGSIIHQREMRSNIKGTTTTPPTPTEEGAAIIRGPLCVC